MLFLFPRTTPAADAPVRQRKGFSEAKFHSPLFLLPAHLSSLFNLFFYFWEAPRNGIHNIRRSPDERLGRDLTFRLTPRFTAVTDKSSRFLSSFRSRGQAHHHAPLSSGASVYSPDFLHSSAHERPVTGKLLTKPNRRLPLPEPTSSPSIFLLYFLHS